MTRDISHKSEEIRAILNLAQGLGSLKIYVLFFIMVLRVRPK